MKTIYKYYPRFVALIIIVVILVMTSGFRVVSARSVQGGAAKPLSTLCLNPSQIGFRKLRIGETEQKSLVIENCGSISLTIHNTTISGADAAEFAVAENPAEVVLPAQEKCYIVAIFKPEALRNGERTSLLNIHSSSDQASVRLVGTAIVPDGLGTKQSPLDIPSGVPPCAPPKPYGLVCLVNRTEWSIAYSYKWGDGDWQSTDVAANGQRSHWWEYDMGSHASPNFKIEFDADFTDVANYKRYDLKRYQASDTICWDGKVYEFEKTGDNTIDLFDPEK